MLSGAGALNATAGRDGCIPISLSSGRICSKRGRAAAVPIAFPALPFARGRMGLRVAPIPFGWFREIAEIR